MSESAMIDANAALGYQAGISRQTAFAPTYFDWAHGQADAKRVAVKRALVAAATLSLEKVVLSRVVFCTNNTHFCPVPNCDGKMCSELP